MDPTDSEKEANGHNRRAGHYNSSSFRSLLATPTTTGAASRPRPLIAYVRNNWDARRSNGSNNAATPPFPTSPGHSYHSSEPRWLRTARAVVSAPRFRRFVVIYVIFALTILIGWQGIYKPVAEERNALIKALDRGTKARVGGWFGTNNLPRLEGLVQLRMLDSSLLPEYDDAEDKPRDKDSKSSRRGRRLVFVGDVHGCKDELEALLDTISFDRNAGDHLVLTGDMIAKGPDSRGVVDLARSLHASCVRGNHEDRVLLFRRQQQQHAKIHGADSPYELPEKAVTPQDKAAQQLARELSDEQASWLEGCPAILRVGSIKGMGEVVVAHAGLVPGVALEHQDPVSVMTMRSIDVETHVPSAKEDGLAWTKLFNKYMTVRKADLEELRANDETAQDNDDNDDDSVGLMTVIYGHDARKGLNLQRYTKGLDSGCVYGRKLTALIISDGGKHDHVQVSCKRYQKA
ncbi:hypothetical protein VTN49DRAFT_5068 [Thermomyces lanuginosus]|uniref:uncharacterized protein n=1 Tax=Thermomyces lanuginosus TaxID=5541 RepID=UPI003743F4B6